MLLLLEFRFGTTCLLSVLMLSLFQSKIGSATQEIKLTNGRYQQTLGKTTLFVRIKTKKQNVQGRRDWQQQPFLNDREQEYFVQSIVSSQLSYIEIVFFLITFCSYILAGYIKTCVKMRCSPTIVLSIDSTT
jgi:hypothetical protein